MLSGGSAFGLAAADGVMRYLEEKRIGSSSAAASCRSCPSAVLFDLSVGDSRDSSGRRLRIRAARAASTDAVAEGNVGAGAGATVGKMLRARSRDEGRRRQRRPSSCPMASSSPRSSRSTPSATSWIPPPAVRRRRAGRMTASASRIAGACSARRLRPASRALENTTIGVVATNAALTKAQATKMAQMAHDGFARAIYPCAPDRRRRRDLRARDRHAPRRAPISISSARSRPMRWPRRSFAPCAPRPASPATPPPGI